MNSTQAPRSGVAQACPVCDAECGGAPLVSYTAERAALHFCPPWRDKDRNARLLRCLRAAWPADKVDILHCDHCGFSFGSPFAGGSGEFYSILHEQMGYPGWRWDYDVALAHPDIRRLDGGRVLDIGAGSGNFLHSLGASWEKHAIESSDTTRAVLAGRGIPAHESVSAGSLTPLRGTFDVITLFQVLEHVSGFREVLDGCHTLLKPGGTLFITVPDGDAMRQQELMTGCPDMPPNHINRWTPSSLGVALRRAGFTPGASVQEPASWRKVGQNLYLAVLADAARPRSVAAQIYRIRRKSLRAPLLRIVGGGLAFLRIARHGNKLRQGGAFALAATRNAG